MGDSPTVTEALNAPAARLSAALAASSWAVVIAFAPLAVSLAVVASEVSASRFVVAVRLSLAAVHVVMAFRVLVALAASLNPA